MHLTYAILDYLRFVAEGSGENAEELASEARVAPLIEVDDGYNDYAENDDEGQAETSFSDELRWPSGEELVPNWILQFFFPLILWCLRLLAYNAYNSPGLLYVTFSQFLFLSK
jgi:hypothetical protein